MYSYGPLHIVEQLESTYSSSVRIRGYIPEGLPEAMNDRERWRERVRDDDDDITIQ